MSSVECVICLFIFPLMPLSIGTVKPGEDGDKADEEEKGDSDLCRLWYSRYQMLFSFDRSN